MSDADLILYLGSKNTSSWSLRPWLVAKRSGLPFREVVIPLRQPDSAANIRAISPTGLVPVLHHGDLVIPDSLAIAEYLAELAPQAGLWPQDRAVRALARAAAAEMHSGFTALRRDMPMDFRGHQPGVGQSPEALANIARIDALWQGCRARFAEEGPFLFGQFSIADAMFAPVVSRFHTYQPQLSPVASAYVTAVMGLDEMQEWYHQAA